MKNKRILNSTPLLVSDLSASRSTLYLWAPVLLSVPRAVSPGFGRLFEGLSEGPLDFSDGLVPVCFLRLILENQSGIPNVDVSIVEIYNSDIFDLAKHNSTVASGVKCEVVTTQDGRTEVLLLTRRGVGGDAKLLVILCVSPEQKHMAETLQSLGFGTRAWQVKRGQARKKPPHSQMRELCLGSA
ncbi:Kinesin-like protein KIF25 [Heterocephalus glaber]|uniref:Kinesin-like protein KIF25 n=1 Tax=Heterocephalus glaber TaxID=10181 RepID=G5ANC9_HETGA|nr:Kinesin-like protein KIF25 [Heterocephalus glaber]